MMISFRKTTTPTRLMITMILTAVILLVATGSINYHPSHVFIHALSSNYRIYPRTNTHNHYHHKRSWSFTHNPSDLKTKIMMMMIPDGVPYPRVRMTPLTTTTTIHHTHRQNLLVRPQSQNRPHHFGTMSVTTLSAQSSSSSLFRRNFSGDSWKETWLEALPSSSVVKAIEQQQQQKSTSSSSSSSSSYMASDIATMAGISLSQANRELMILASLTQGNVAVTSNGELQFTFPTNLRQVIMQNSVKYKSLQTWQTKIWPRLFWLFRISFGLTLFVSLLAIFTTIVFVGTYGGSSNNNNDDNNRNDRRSNDGMRLGGGGGWGWNFNYFWGPSPWDLFWYRPYYGSYYRQQQQQDRMGGYDNSNEVEEMGLLESIFSYVFGDGNPNIDLEQRRLQLAAQVIRQNNGMVTAEQLAPFCDPPVDDRTTTTTTTTSLLNTNVAFVDESFVLPIVTQLNGEPQVTDDGHIVYIFPELLQSATVTTKDMSLSQTTSFQLQQQQNKQAKILRRAGLRPDASSNQIRQLLQYNGISTRGALEKSDLIRILEQVLPPENRKTQKDGDDNDDDEDDFDGGLMLRERKYKFSLASDLNKFLAGGLGIVNLLGALYLGGKLAPLSALVASSYQVPVWLTLIQTAYPWLLTYAVLFNVIPLFRSWYIRRQNEQIRQRNQGRKMWKKLLMEPNKNREFQAKLQSVGLLKRRFQEKQQKALLSNQEIVFDTSQSMEEQTKSKELQAMKEFDDLLQQQQQKQQTQDEIDKGDLLPPP